MFTWPLALASLGVENCLRSRSLLEPWRCELVTSPFAVGSLGVTSFLALPIALLFGVSGPSWGSFWGDFGAHLGCLGALLGRLGALLGRLGASWRPLAVLGLSWGPLGAVLGVSWAVLGLSWAVLGPSWAVLEPSWAVLVPSWVPFGPSGPYRKNHRKTIGFSMILASRALLGVPWSAS